MPDRSIRAPLGAQPDTRDGDRRSALDLFLEPRSIAVIGASDDPTRIGGRTLFNIRQGGFPGPVYPINPRRQTVPGLRAWSAIGDGPAAIECSVVARPGALVLDAVDQCAAKGSTAHVRYPAGVHDAGAAVRTR